MGTLGGNKSPDGTRKTEVVAANIPSSIPVAVKNGVLNCSREAINAVKNAVSATCLAGAALAMGSAPAMAADQQKEQTAMLQANGFSGPSLQWVLALSRFVQEKTAAGWLAPTEAVRFEPVAPISQDGTGLNQLVNTGSKLPKKTFQEVANASALSAENYASVVEKLFNPADIDVWLTKPDGSPMSAQEKADYKESLEATKKRWLAKLPELSNAGKQELINRWFTLFNTLATKPIHGSREEYRRGLIAANSIANWSSVPTDKQRLFAPATTTQAAEYILMTDPRAQMVKVERNFNEPGKPVFSLKYLIASDESLKKIGFPEGIQATQVALQGWNQDQAKIYESYAKIAAADSKLAAADSKLAAADSKLAAADSKLAAADSKLAFLDKFNTLSNRFNDTSAIIMKQLDILPNKRTDHVFVESLNKNLQELKALKLQLDILTKEDAEKRYISDRGKETIGLLYATIVDTAKLKKAPIQNI